VDFGTGGGESAVCPGCGALLKVPSDPLIGSTLGEFGILELLGRGGMGAVYKARQVSLDRLVALKVLPESLSRNAAFAERFRREARAAAAVRHPNIIEVHAVGEDQGHQFIAMEFIEGETLAARLKREGRLDPGPALDILRQTAAALRKAHDAGILHRDIKPSNILLDADGLVKVADFGLAKRPDKDVSVTQTGHNLGTPLYMPPEVCRGRKADARSDLYSLGATFYQVLAGRPPFEGESSAELVAKHIEAALVPLQQLAADAPSALCRLIHRLLRKDPAERYQSAAEVLEALAKVEARVARPAPTGSATTHTAPTRPARERRRAAAVTAPRAGRRSRRALALGAAVAVAAIALVLLLALRGKRTEPRATSRAMVPVATPPSPPRPEQGPATPAPDAREAEARDLFDFARRAAGSGTWLSADTYLGKLDRTCADTKFCAANRAAIDALRAKIKAALTQPADVAQDVIVLKTGDAVIRSSSPDGPWLKYETDRASLRDWRHSEDSVSWQFSIGEPGRYEVAAVYSMGNREGGSTYSVGVGTQVLKGVVSNTDGWDDFREWKLGTLSFAAPGTVLLSVRPTQIRPDCHLMDLRSLILRRLKPDGTPIVPPTADPPPPSGKQTTVENRPPEPKPPTPEPKAGTEGIRKAAAAYARESDKVWALLGERKYDEAGKLIEERATRPELKLAAEHIQADREAVSLLGEFWRAVEKGLPALKGRTLVLGGVGGTVESIEGGVITLRTPVGETQRSSMRELAAQQAAHCSGLGSASDAHGSLLLGVFLLAECADLDDAAEALAKAGGGPAVALYRSRLRAVALDSQDASARAAWRRIESAAGEGRLTRNVARQLQGMLDEFVKQHGKAGYCRELQEPTRTLKARIEQALVPPVYTQWPFSAAEARRRQEETATFLGVKDEEELDLGGGVKLTLVLIPAGEFVMGSPEKPPPELARLEGAIPDWYRREVPAHRVRITRPFWLGKGEVTQKQWLAVMGKNPSQYLGPQNPVERVSWDDCQAFTGTLGARLGDKRLRLPTEAEWEYACRGGSAALFSGGDSVPHLMDHAWFYNNSGQKPHPIGQRKPNAWGLHDMHGNAWEWCQDAYASYKADAQTDPAGSPRGFGRIIRGGAWYNYPGYCRSASRSWLNQKDAEYYCGFRLARSLQ